MFYKSSCVPLIYSQIPLFTFFNVHLIFFGFVGHISVPFLVPYSVEWSSASSGSLFISSILDYSIGKKRERRRGIFAAHEVSHLPPLTTKVVCKQTDEGKTFTLWCRLALLFPSWSKTLMLRDYWKWCYFLKKVILSLGAFLSSFPFSFAAHLHICVAKDAHMHQNSNV